MNTRALYWSVRREIWENRSVYLAPLIVTAVVLFGSMVSLVFLPQRIRNLPTDPVQRHALATRPHCTAPVPIMLATFLVGFFYSIDALYGERRDRSILFWKSLPVSDRTTVLSKLAIPCVVLPLAGFLLSLITQVFLIVMSTLVLLGSGVGPGPFLAEIRYPQEPMVMMYGLTVHMLWFLPIHGWFLLVSAWAKRAPLLWALFPFLLPAAMEAIAFKTSHIGAFLKNRLSGAMGIAFTDVAQREGAIDRLAHLSPGRFLTSPGLWLGLFFTAACVAAVIRMRRTRQPI